MKKQQGISVKTKILFIFCLFVAFLSGIAFEHVRMKIDLVDKGATFQAQPSIGKANLVNAPTNLLQTLEKEAVGQLSNAESLARLGNAYFDAGEFRKAIDAYEKSLQYAPDNVSVIVDCGIMYRAIGDFDTALRLFRRAQQIDPRHEIARFNEGVVLLFDLNKKDEALLAWKRLIQINPGAKAPSGEPVASLVQQLEGR